MIPLTILLTPQMQSITDRLKNEFTPDKIKALAADSNVLLSHIERREDFVGASIRFGLRQWYRAKDYEIVRFTETASPDEVMDRCREAIITLGERIECCLRGTPRARTFVSALQDGPLDGEGLGKASADSVLYSVGPVPRMLEADGIAIREEMEDPDPGVDALSGPCRPRLFQIRFGYYAQTVPKQALFSLQEKRSD